MLLKVALLLGVEVHVNVEFKHLVEPPEDQEKRMNVIKYNFTLILTTKLTVNFHICPVQVLVGEQKSILSLIQSVSWSLMWLLVQMVEETLYQVSAKTHGLRPVMIRDNPINATNSRGFIWITVSSWLHTIT